MTHPDPSAIDCERLQALHRRPWFNAVGRSDKVQAEAFKIDKMQSDHSTDVPTRRKTGLPAEDEEDRNAIRCFSPGAKQCFKSQGLFLLGTRGRLPLIEWPEATPHGFVEACHTQLRGHAHAKS